MQRGRKTKSRRKKRIRDDKRSRKEHNTRQKRVCRSKNRTLHETKKPECYFDSIDNFDESEIQTYLFSFFLFGFICVLFFFFII